MSKCIYDNCQTQSSYNYDGQSKGLFCMAHKLDGMINVKNKKCIHSNCNKYPNFNIDGQSKGLYCYDHKLDGMIDVITKRCLYDNCKKIPVFNIDGQSKGLYCYDHKLDGMINVITKKCLYDNCKKIPVFNINGQSKGLYCYDHKLDGMIDVITKRCLYDNCKKIPVFNIDGQSKGLYCAIHKKEGMVDIKHKKCIHSNCKKSPNFNIDGQSKGLYCYDHKLDGMINVITKKCKTPLCLTQIKNKYDGYCMFCYINLFPDKPVSRNYKTKESAVVKYIKSKYPDFTWITDKKIQGGCSKKRPDLLLDLGYQVIIVEIDENQHIDYDCSCENKRLMELSLDLGHRPIIFIRFNPDDYILNGQKITSCWSINTLGLSTVKISKKTEWDKRLETLSSQVEYWSNPDNKTNKTVEVINLFYDS